MVLIGLGFVMFDLSLVEWKFFDILFFVFKKVFWWG